MRCTEALLFRWYGEHNEFSRFMLTEGAQKILLVSRAGERIRSVLRRMRRQGERTLLIFDEVHGAGSAAFRETAGPELQNFRFRLGLSATPIREFDEAGTEFLEREIGPVIFRFGLADAIRKGILCSFRYGPLYSEAVSSALRGIFRGKRMGSRASGIS